MPTIFGPEWEALDLPDIQAFLDGADDEPLVWEAKGPGTDKHHVRRAVCGFANSHEGGYLVAGATRDGGVWKLSGVEFPDEPAVWIDSVVRDEVRPTPQLDVRAWRVEESERHVAIARVEPVAVPPCITRGTVYERVPGRTVPVKEPLRLAELFARGDHARAEAQAKARRARADMLTRGRTHPNYTSNRVQVAVGAATAAYLVDISSRVFSENLRTSLMALADATLDAGPAELGVQRQAAIRQDAHSVTTSGPEGGWTVSASWDGSLGVFWVMPEENLSTHHFVQHAIDKAWQASRIALGEIGGYGPVYVAIAVCGAGHPQNVETYGADPAPGTKLDRGPIDLTASDLDLASVERELNRALGRDAFEPGE